MRIACIMHCERCSVNCGRLAMLAFKLLFTNPENPVSEIMKTKANIYINVNSEYIFIKSLAVPRQ